MLLTTKTDLLHVFILLRYTIMQYIPKLWNNIVYNPDTIVPPGDIRVNEQTGLTSIHALWVREHNRVVEELVSLHDFPEGTVEEREFLYQSARRIVIAEYQVSISLFIANVPIFCQAHLQL